MILEEICKETFCLLIAQSVKQCDTLFFSLISIFLNDVLTTKFLLSFLLPFTHRKLLLEACLWAFLFSDLIFSYSGILKFMLYYIFCNLHVQF